MADIVVSVAMGVMKPLLEKLTKLMGDEYLKLKGLRKEVSFLKRELSDMNALLEKMDDADELDPQAKNWRKDVIDMSYDIEDYIEDFMERVGEAGDNVGILQRAYDYLRTIKDRHCLANQLQEIKTLVIEAGERRKRYMLDQCIPITTRVSVDPRLSVLYQKSESLVGIDSQKEEIVRWVMDEEQQQLKVMSIVGFGGLGKTTLANDVYHTVGSKFNCKAIVSVSQKPDIVKLLNSLMIQLGLQPYSHACEPQDLINNIREHLQGTRYFIIVDDLWDIRAWTNAISCAFPQNNHYSRVMITTRIENVARASCENHGFIHYMKSLSEQDSRKLFFDRICESEIVCPDVIELSCKILKKCGGLPLAIITMASMIACQPTTSKGQWAEYIQNSLDAGYATTTPSYEDMMHILDFSYKNLPHHLKACFLYLGIYPEDHKISRVELVRRWVAEGFVSCSPGQEVWNVAENYFSELVNRSMIQPAYEDYDASCIEVTHCRVHDMMLELILRKCREDNFISLINGPEMMLEGQDKVVRRLTIDLRSGAEGGITQMGNTWHLSQVRSLNLFRGNCRIPNLEEFKFLRLLFLDIGNIKTDVDLSGINHLPQLRYLKVIERFGNRNKVLLPAQIRSVHALETLDLSDLCRCCSIPEFVDLPRLSHLSVPENEEVRLPDCIGKFKSLVTLSGFTLSRSSLESVKSLGELTALSELIFAGEFFRDTGGMIPVVAALIASLGKLGNLRNLILGNAKFVYCGDAMLEPSFSPPFRKIVKLHLGLLIFSRVPRWIGQLCCLRNLYLRTKEIHQDDFNVIGTRLTSLVWLSLTISRIPTKRIVIGGSTTGFNVLKVFGFDCDGVSCLTFEAGAMPNLELLALAIDADGWDGAAPDGLQHLHSLKEIWVLNVPEPAATAMRTGEEESAVIALTKDVFHKASEALPTRPGVTFRGWDPRPKEMT